MYFIAVLFLSLLNELITGPHVNYLHKIIMHIFPKGYVTTKVTYMLLIKLNQICTMYKKVNQTTFTCKLDRDVIANLMIGRDRRFKLHHFCKKRNQVIENFISLSRFFCPFLIFAAYIFKCSIYWTKFYLMHSLLECSLLYN